MRVRLHQQRERFAVAELVVAPLLEPLENRVEAQLRVLLEQTIDGDVARVADLLRQVGGVEDELRLEVGVLLRLRQEGEVHRDVEILERVVDEAGMPTLVARHQGEELAHVRVLDVLLELDIEHAAREFRRHRRDQEVLELLLEPFRQRGQVEVVPLVGALEVALVGVVAHLLDQRVPVLAQPARRRSRPWPHDRSCRSAARASCSPGRAWWSR